MIGVLNYFPYFVAMVTLFILAPQKGYWRQIAHLPHVGFFAICAHFWLQIYSHAWAALKIQCLYAEVSIHSTNDVRVYSQLPWRQRCCPDWRVSAVLPSRTAAKWPVGDRINHWTPDKIDKSNNTSGFKCVSWLLSWLDALNKQRATWEDVPHWVI